MNIVVQNPTTPQAIMIWFGSNYSENNGASIPPILPRRLADPYTNPIISF